MNHILLKRHASATKLVQHYLPDVWSFEYDRAVRRAGACNFQKRKITVSRHYAAQVSDEEFRQILLHEIAHAIAGSAHGHDEVWRKVAIRIGYTGGRLINTNINIEAPWKGKCPAGHDFVRFKKPSRALSCGECGRGFSPNHLIEWKYSAQ